MSQYNVLPIWGVRRESELDERLRYLDNEPEITQQIQKYIEKDWSELLRKNSEDQKEIVSGKIKV